ncbi:bifunctional RNase H/acid phosphatase [Streptomyces pseudovenezuelae]|uniref:Broad specificity phosphatase PhoE/ribonuclease HI n=1 Tax=Streptomyces pseudovenezuelae TaxID=67350 RepID=A0ABT6LG68_9ACTN|nr:bifunctional RNase H/acid phosphatase [Streptomyces pseudovenezuelae]MDH6215292.1 broad specificity phosphatase PhoE/ribonuclease HI [Streptomyces pseudovenezuelae]
MREFIVEADGGSRGNPGPAGYGSVVLDAATGETLMEAAEYIGVATNNVAEYRGLLAGLRAAYALDPSASVHVRMDSKLVVEQMSGRWKIKHPDMKPLAAEAAGIFPPDRVTYEWIPREQNKHADRLANEAMDAGKRGEQWSAEASTAELDAGQKSERWSAGAPTAELDAGQRGERWSAVTSGAQSDVPFKGRGELRDQPPPAATVATTDKTTVDTRAARNVSAAPKPTVGWGSSPDMGAPATFVLLRHGETPLTPQKRFSGSGGTDPSLSEVGRDQAERAGAALARRGTIQAIVASPLTRTRETAAIVAAHLGLEVTIDEGLRETDFGAWEGLTFGEVRERHPEDLTAWLADPEAQPTGGGESFAETGTRIAATRDKLVAAYAGRTVLLVSHVTPIKTFVRLALGAPPEALFRMELSAAALSAVAYFADGNASVRLFNDTSHLR